MIRFSEVLTPAEIAETIGYECRHLDLTLGDVAYTEDYGGHVAADPEAFSRGWHQADDELRRRRINTLWFRLHQRLRIDHTLPQEAAT